MDAARGIAICLMFAYHFAFDLRYYGVLQANFEHDPFWLGFRALIVTSFLTIVGMSLVLADHSGMTTRRFLRRLGVLALAALAVSAGSWLVFPRAFIYFGILHCIAVASLLAWPLRRHPRWAAALGLVVLVAGLTLSHPWFDAPGLSWIGLRTFKPDTQDYAPLAPWSAAVFLGIAGGHWLLRSGTALLSALRGAPPALTWLGRHSLIVYLVHQPLMLGVMWLLLRP